MNVSAIITDIIRNFWFDEQEQGHQGEDTVGGTDGYKA